MLVKELVDAKESQDECFCQARDLMVERRVLERLAVWEVHVGHLDEALRGALRETQRSRRGRFKPGDRRYN